MSEAPSYEIMSVLAEYISRKMKSPRLKTSQVGWPDGATKLTVPALSIVTRGNPLPTHHAPHLLSVGNIIESQSGELVRRHTDNIYECGDWNFNLQVDLWLKTSAERYDAQQSLIQLFYEGEERVSQSIRLAIPNYHDAIAVYTFMNSSVPDSSTTPLAQEWRVMVDIACTVPNLVKRGSERVINDFELVDEIEEL